MGVKKFILESKDIEKDSFLWNMIACLLMAFQSVIVLMILTRTVGLIESGIYTIAYANANLFLNIGKYGMRNFQVSDVKNEYNFKCYRNSRTITVGIMIIVVIIYIIISSRLHNYTFNKSMVILWMCLFKSIDALEDVYHGFYQKSGRLDIGAKSISVRLIVTIMLFVIIVIISKNLLLSLIISTIASFIIYKVLIKWTYEPFKNTEFNGNKKTKLKNLLIECFPLFMGAFLAFYIGNAPKYAIDTQLTDELQACYGFIAMPVFVVGLLNNFIFNPLLYQISRLWAEGKNKKFLHKILRQCAVIIIITTICIAGAYIIGIPVLSILYNTNLSGFKNELLILLLGGGFLGLSGLLNSAITILRFQNSVVWGYGSVAVVAFFFSDVVVLKNGILGASLLYLILMILLCVLFTLFFIYAYLRKANKG